MALLMSTHNIYFHGEIKIKISVIFGWKKYLVCSSDCWYLNFSFYAPNFKEVGREYFVGLVHLSISMVHF